MRQCLIGVVVLLCGCWFGTASWAAGNFLPGNGARSAGMAGAVVASGEDVDAMIFNPANFSRLRGFGFRFDSYLSFQQVDFKRANYKDKSFKRIEKDPSPVYIPTLAIWYNFGDLVPGSLTLSLFAYAPHGRNGFDYPEEAGTCNPAAKGDAQACDPMAQPGAQRLNLIRTSSPMIYFGFGAGYGYKFSNDFALRVGGTLKVTTLSVFQRQAAIAASSLYQDGSEKITSGEVIMDVSGSGVYVTGDLGVTLEMPYGFQLGVSVLFPAVAEATGELQVELAKSLSGLAQIEGKGLKLTTSFPMILRSGLAWQGYGLKVEAGIVYERWSIQQNITLAPQNIKIKALGSDTVVPTFDVPQDLVDSLSVRVGAEYDILGRAMVRAGFVWEKGATPVDKLSVVSVDWPDKMGVSVGGSIKIPGGLHFDVSFVYMLPANIVITNSKLNPVDVSPAALKRKDPIAPVANGDYNYGLMMLNFGLRGNWGT